MERDMALHTAEHVAAAFELYHYMGDWIWAAYMNSSEEDKAMFREDKDFLMMLRLTPKDVEKWGMDKKEKMDGEHDMKDEDMKPDDKASSLIGGMPNLLKVLRFWKLSKRSIDVIVKLKFEVWR